MGRLITLSEAERTVLLEQVSTAKKESDREKRRRERCQNAYHARPTGKEDPNRSNYISRLVHQQVQGSHPHLIKRFMAADHRVIFTGPDAKTCKVIKKLCRDAIQDAGGFNLINTVLIDGEVSNFGVSKVFWSRRWGKPSRGVRRGLSVEDLQRLAADPEVSISRISQEAPEVAHVSDVLPGDTMPTVVEVESAATYTAEVTVTPLLESAAAVKAMPPEEFLAMRGKVSMNDRRACGHVRKMLFGELVRENERLSTPGSPYYRNLRRALEATAVGSPGGASASVDDERRRREELHYDPTNEELPESYSNEEMRREVELVEWQSLIVDGGDLVPAITTLLDGQEVRCEENEDGIVGYSGWSPFPDPHSLIGHGIAHLHVDNQNLQTTFGRAAQDQVAYSIDKVTYTKGAGIDLLALQNRYPGKVVFGVSKNDIEEADPPNIDFRIFKIIEYLQGDAENTGPGTRYNFGNDGEGLNPTATGVTLIQRAAFTRIDMIALAFGELYLVDLYNKLAWLHQRNLDKPRTVVVDGEEIEVTKDMLQGDYRARLDLGMEIDFDDREFQKNMMLAQDAMATAQALPMLYPLEKLYNVRRRLYVSAGLRDPGEAIEPPPPGWEKWTLGAPPPGTPPTPAVGPDGLPLPGTQPPSPTEASGIALGSLNPQASGEYVGGQGDSQPDEGVLA